VDPAHVALDASGNAVFAWTEGVNEQSRAYARRMSADGTLGPVVDIAAPGDIASQPQVTFVVGGVAIVAWSNVDGRHHRVLARSWPPAGALGPAFLISDPDRASAANPQLAIDARGRHVVFSWTIDTPNTLPARTSSPAGKLGPIIDLDGSVESEDRHIAVAGTGAVFFTWVGDDYWLENEIFARALSPVGRLSPFAPIGRDDRTAYVPVAADAKGNVLLTWRRFEHGRSRIVAKTFPAQGRPSRLVHLSAAEVDARGPQLAMTAAGHAVVAWIAGNASAQRVQVVADR
jgi:hypothetical protein